MDRLLTTAEVLAIVGLADSTLNSWIEKGLFVPTVPGGRGRGNSHLYSVTQAVGIAVAAALLQGERGCAASYIGAVVRAFTDWSEPELRRALAKGRTHFVMVHQGKPLLQGKSYDWPNVSDLYREVEEVAG